MNWFIRIYNQNRKLLLVILIIIIVAIIIIKGLDYLSSKLIEKKNEEAKNEGLTSNQIYNRNESLLYGEDSISSSKAEIFNNIIDNFLNYCLNGDLANAYSLLSKDCREELYPSQELFEKQYCHNIFGNNMTYNFQYWQGNTYQVTILDDILKTGGKGNKTVDYYSLVKENEDYKLNINGLIWVRSEKISENKDGVYITIDKISQYKDYAIYNINIKNDTDKNILLDSQTNSNSVYAVNGNDSEAVRLRAFIEELNINDLFVSSKSEKSLSIKFNTSYSSTINIKSIVFSNIIMDYDSYKENSSNYSNINSIKLVL